MLKTRYIENQSTGIPGGHDWMPVGAILCAAVFMPERSYRDFLNGNQKEVGRLT